MSALFLQHRVSEQLYRDNRTIMQQNSCLEENSVTVQLKLVQ